MSANAETGRADLLALARASGRYADALRCALEERRAGAADAFTIRDLCAEEPDEARLLLLLLVAALNEGALCLVLQKENLAERLERLHIPEEEIGAWVERILAWIAGSPPLCTRIGEEGALRPPPTPLVLRLPAGAGTPLLYFQRYYHYEARLEADLRARLQRPLTPPAEGELPALRRMLEEACPPEIHAEQKLAVALGALSPFLLLTGGPGTGKTTTILSLLRLLSRRGVDPERILLTAPTGRAAYRLTESLRAGLARAAGGGPPAEADRPLSRLEARTLHRALRYLPGRNIFAFHRGNPLPADVVVVDEVSMVDVVLMTRLLEALPPEARIVLVGDRNQLPSVEAGAVLTDLVPQEARPAFSAGTRRVLEALGLAAEGYGDAESLFRDRLVFLRQSHRAGGELGRFACGDDAARSRERLLRAASVESFVRADETDAEGGRRVGYAWPDVAEGGTALRRIVPPAGADAAALRFHWRQVVEDWSRRHYLSPPRENGAPSYAQRVRACDGRPPGWFRQTAGQDHLRLLLDGIEEARLLTLPRRGIYGCHAVNRQMVELLRKPLGGVARGERFAGLPVLVTANDYRHEVFNGDVGVLVRPAGETWRVALPRPDEVRLLPLDALPGWEPAFAMTVHKSQGSEYGEVLLCLPPIDAEAADPLLTREIVYTGITRARRVCIVYGSGAAIEKALERRIERASGLRL